MSICSNGIVPGERFEGNGNFACTRTIPTRKSQVNVAGIHKSHTRSFPRDREPLPLSLGTQPWDSDPPVWPSPEQEALGLILHYPYPPLRYLSCFLFLFSWCLLLGSPSPPSSSSCRQRGPTGPTNACTASKATFRSSSR